MRPCRSKLGWFAIAALILGAPTPVQDQVTLRYKFKQGETLPYVMQQKMKTSVSAGGKNFDMSMTMTIDITMRVQSVESNGSAQIAEKIGRIRFAMEGVPGQGKIKYDTKSGEKPAGPVAQAMAPILGALSGAEFTMTMDRQGSVSNFKMPEELTKKLKQAAGGGAQAGMFSPDQVKQMVHESLVLPKGPVAKGKSWEQKLDMAVAGGTLTGKNVLTYQGTVNRDGKKLEEIAIKPDYTFKASPKAGMKLQMKVKNASGKSYFDNHQGRLVESRLDQTMEMAMSVAGQEMTQTSQQKVTMKLAGGHK